MKPILFNTEMVKAILDGRKTVTRRVIKPSSKKACGFSIVSRNDGKGNYAFEDVYDADDEERMFDSPQSRVRVGDVLYVRETWQNVFETEYDRDAEGYCVDIRTRISNFDNIPKRDLGLSTEDSCAFMKPRTKYCVYSASDISYSDEKHKLKWRPSLHMPKEAARIFLKVTGVRVERLQDMKHEDPMKEGIRSFTKDNSVYKFAPCDGWLPWSEMPRNPTKAFELLWNSTIKKSDLDRYGWDENPWVWVIEFERCDKPESEVK